MKKHAPFTRTPSLQSLAPLYLADFNSFSYLFPLPQPSTTYILGVNAGWILLSFFHSCSLSLSIPFLSASKRRRNWMTAKSNRAAREKPVLSSIPPLAVISSSPSSSRLRGRNGNVFVPPRPWLSIYPAISRPSLSLILFCELSSPRAADHRINYCLLLLTRFVGSAYRLILTLFSRRRKRCGLSRDDGLIFFRIAVKKDV